MPCTSNTCSNDTVGFGERCAVVFRTAGGALRPSEMASRSRGELNEGEVRALCQTVLQFCNIVVNCCAREFYVVLCVT